MVWELAITFKRFCPCPSGPEVAVRHNEEVKQVT